MEELMPSARSPKHRRGRWRKHIKPNFPFILESVQRKKAMNIASEYIRGFVDAEGSFTLGISEKPRKTKKIQVVGMFAITQTGEKGRILLESIQKFLNCDLSYLK